MVNHDSLHCRIMTEAPQGGGKGGGDGGATFHDPSKGAGLASLAANYK